jgi:gas vesicle protein
METKERGFSHFLTGLLIGGTLGGLAGVLFAPKSGKELRTDIKETGRDAFEGTRATVGKANHQFSEMGQRAKRILSCVKQKGEAAPQYDVESMEEYVGEA